MPPGRGGAAPKQRPGAPFGRGKGESGPETEEKAPAGKKGKPAGKAPPFGKAAGATDPGEILAKSAPPEIRAAFARLGPAEQTDLIMAGAPIVAGLVELDARTSAVPITDRPALVKAWVAGLEPHEQELLKFWGLAARGALAVAPMAGRMAASAGRGIGMLGPKLSRLFGVGRATAAAERQAGAAAAAGTHIPPVPGSPGAATPSLGYRASRTARGAAGYGAKAVRGLGRHAYANRGGYGLTAGWEAGRRWGAEDQG